MLPRWWTFKQGPEHEIESQSSFRVAVKEMYDKLLSKSRVVTGECHCLLSVFVSSKLVSRAYATKYYSFGLPAEKAKFCIAGDVKREDNKHCNYNVRIIFTM